MEDRKRLICNTVLMGLGVLSVLFPLPVRGAENNTMAVIEEAKVAIEEARLAGAEKKASDILAQAKSWLVQAEKEYADSQSLLSRTVKWVASNEAKTREIIYLGTIAGTKARIAEMKAQKVSVVEELKEVQKDLADYRTALEVLSRKLAEAETAKKIQAKAETELKALAQAKQRAAELEEQKKRELEAAQKKSAELEALKQKELQQSQQQEAQKTAEDRLRKEGAERKAKEEQLAAMQEKMAVLEKEKAMLADAGKIPQTVVRSTDQEIILALPVTNLFSPKNELHPQGKAILGEVAVYLKKYPTDRIVIRGYTDSTGKAALNQSLSGKRALRVKEYLVLQQNIPPAGITTEGLGPTQPVASNDTEAGRALNRRVEIGIAKGP